MTVYGNGLMTPLCLRPAHLPAGPSKDRAVHPGRAGLPAHGVRNRGPAVRLRPGRQHPGHPGPDAGIRGPRQPAARRPRPSPSRTARQRERPAAPVLLRPHYRLISATGRECDNIPVPRPVTDDPRCGYNSGGFGSLTQDNAPSMTVLYTETYGYDPVGDLVTLRHQTAAATWTRNFGFGGLQPQDWQAAWTAHLNTGSSWANPPTTRLTHFGNDPAAITPDLQLRPGRQPDRHHHIPAPRLGPTRPARRLPHAGRQRRRRR